MVNLCHHYKIEDTEERGPRDILLGHSELRVRDQEGPVKVTEKKSLVTKKENERLCCPK